MTPDSPLNQDGRDRSSLPINTGEAGLKAGQRAQRGQVVIERSPNSLAGGWYAQGRAQTSGPRAAEITMIHTGLIEISASAPAITTS